MPTKPKVIKIRDSEQTQNDLLNSVGKVLAEKGFRGLTTKNITTLIGKDKNIIRYHFKTLKELEKAYINKIDYWPPVLMEGQLRDYTNKKELADLIKCIMLENFRRFFDNKEMQQIILWQISEANPLLKSISESREIEGEKLLKLTDPFFEKTNVNFRAVIALLLGGIYYLTLHGRYNKSTVSGMDINKAKDRAEFKTAIEQILEWAWQDDDKNMNAKN
ncbi:TetR/AcrR family transcriptional regulator [Mucilaginibacter sp. UYCu711]|uniref:TetR/AcrR family transcriptional regulator n=1 Tax=Mucilaginibacter sp. UYCu711 TaxID=3156339 RepID=UPI003D208B85